MNLLDALISKYKWHLNDANSCYACEVSLFGIATTSMHMFTKFIQMFADMEQGDAKDVCCQQSCAFKLEVCILHVVTECTKYIYMQQIAWSFK